MGDIVHGLVVAWLIQAFGAWPSGARRAGRRVGDGLRRRTGAWPEAGRGFVYLPGRLPPLPPQPGTCVPPSIMVEVVPAVAARSASRPNREDGRLRGVRCSLVLARRSRAPLVRGARARRGWALCARARGDRGGRGERGRVRWAAARSGTRQREIRLPLPEDDGAPETRTPAARLRHAPGYSRGAPGEQRVAHRGGTSQKSRGQSRGPSCRPRERAASGARQSRASGPTAK